MHAVEYSKSISTNNMPILAECNVETESCVQNITSNGAAVRIQNGDAHGK